MLTQLGRFICYFCVVLVICLALSYFFNVPTGELTGVLISLLVAVTVLAFKNWRVVFERRGSHDEKGQYKP